MHNFPSAINLIKVRLPRFARNDIIIQAVSFQGTLAMWESRRGKAVLITLMLS